MMQGAPSRSHRFVGNFGRQLHGLECLIIVREQNNLCLRALSCGEQALVIQQSWAGTALQKAEISLG